MQIQIKNFVKRIFNRLGFEICRLSKDTDLLAYSIVRACTTYAPWRKDILFQNIYKTIQPYTLVDQNRCYELWQLTEQSLKLVSGNIIEIGVWRGGTGALIAKRAKENGSSDEVYLCDTFAGVVKAGARDSSYKGGEHSDTSRQLVERLISGMGLNNVKLLEGIFPDQTGCEIQQLRFRFCHIDVDVYQSAHDIMEWIWGRMVHGGIVVFDDYGSPTCDGITTYVNEQIQCKDRIFISNLNGHAVIIKL